MIELRVVIGLLLISSLGYGKVEKAPTKAAQEEAEQLFKSDLGFEIKIPKCLLVAPSNDADDSEKDPKTVNIAITNNGPKPCHLNQEKVMLVVSNRETLNPGESLEDWVESMEKHAVLSKKNGGTNYLLTKRNALQNTQYFMVSEWHGAYLRFEAYVICGKKIFTLKVRQDIQNLQSIVSNIKNGDPSLPEVEKKMIESFRCAEKK